MLEDLELFSSLSRNEVQEIAQITQRAEYRRGEFVFQQGDRSRDLYAVESGQVEIVAKNILSENRVLATLKNGDLFGEMALFDPNMVRSASARCLQNTVLIIIPGDKFERLLKEKPTISFKLLGTLSKRIKEANQHPSGRPQAPKTEARIITVAGPRNGAGKTTFAVTLAQILAHEGGVRTLFIDLDLPFADGTYAMGVHSVRTVVEFTQTVRGGIADLEAAKKLFVQVGPNLSCLPGPVNLVEGEKVDPKALTTGIRQLQKFFDFIVIDTDAHIEERTMAAIDLADRIFFLVDAGTPYSIKSSARYFFGLSKLHLPEERMTVLVGKSPETLDQKALSGLLKLPVKGQLPLIANHAMTYGQGILATQADHPYCQAIRRLLQTFFAMEFQSNRPGGFFSRLFGADQALAGGVPPLPSALVKSQTDSSLDFREANFRALLRSIRTGLVAGAFDEARAAVLRLLESSGPSSPLFQTYGEILMQEGNLSEATDAFRKAAQLDGSNHLAVGYAAILTLDRASFDQAVALLEKKIEKNPTWPDLRRDLGELYLRNNRPGEAIAPLQEALKRNDRYEDARVRLAEAQERLGRFEEALKTLQAMKQKNAPAFYLMGTCLQSINRFVEALGAFRLVQKINPSFRAVEQRIADLQGYFDKLNALIAMHQKIRREQPSYPDIRVRLAQLLAAAGRREEALTECRDALQLNPGFRQAQEEIDRIGQLGEIILDRPPTIDHPKHPCNGLPCTGFHIELDFGKFGADPLFHERLANHTLGFRNVRTGKTFQFRLPQTLAENMDVVGSSICPVTESDVIQIRMEDPQTGEILFSDSQVIDASEEPLCKIRIHLEEPIQRIADRLPTLTPVRSFLIGMERKTIPGPDSASPGVPIPLVAVNTRTELRAEGRIDADQATQLYFVFRSPGAEDVVKTGDILEIRTTTPPEKVLMRIRLTPEDLAAYGRFIGAEEGSLFLEA